MTHEELRDRLLDLACGELSPRDARAVEEHAASCPACGAELARLRGTRRLMAALPEEPAPAAGEAILLAAAREAVRGREPPAGQRSRLPRWLWAAPVVAASLAAVLAVSLRLGAVRPPAAGRDDPNAILGESPYARAPASTPAPEAPAATAVAPQQDGAERAGDAAEPPAAVGAKRAEAGGERAARAERKAAAPRAQADEAPRFATPPPPAAPEREQGAGRVASAPAAPPPLARAAPAPAAPTPADSAGPAQRPSGPAPAPAPAPAPRAGLSAAMPAPSADPGAAPEARAEAAPAPARRAKAMAGQAARDEYAAATAPRDRALAAARARAAALPFDTRGLAVTVAPAPVSGAEWLRDHPGERGRLAALEGRALWVVTFLPPAGGEGLTVLVEDGTFRPLADLPAR